MKVSVRKLNTIEQALVESSFALSEFTKGSNLVSVVKALKVVQGLTGKTEKPFKVKAAKAVALKKKAAKGKKSLQAAASV